MLLASLALSACASSSEQDISSQGGKAPIACVDDRSHYLGSCRDGSGRVWACHFDWNSRCESVDDIVRPWTLPITVEVPK
jgi:hypothetical protein